MSVLLGFRKMDGIKGNDALVLFSHFTVGRCRSDDRVRVGECDLVRDGSLRGHLRGRQQFANWGRAQLLDFPSNNLELSAVVIGFPVNDNRELVSFEDVSSRVRKRAIIRWEDTFLKDITVGFQSQPFFTNLVHG